MNELERTRYQALQHDWIPINIAADIVGADPAGLEPRLNAFGRLFRQPKQAFQGALVSRYLFEVYLQHSGLLPRPVASLHLGMTEDSLVATLNALEDQELIVRNTLDWPDDVVEGDFVKSIHTFIPELRHTTFGDHSSYCRDVHAALARQFGVDVEAVYCSTSELLDEAPYDLAYERCCVSHRPTGLRHQIPLNFGKPLRLAPDVCAKRFYAIHVEELQQYVLGTPPLIDDVLEAGG